MVGMGVGREGEGEGINGLITVPRMGTVLETVNREMV